MINKVFEDNLALNNIEIAEKRKNLSSRPISLICAITNKCNTRCIMCDTWSTPWELPEKTYKEVIQLLPYLKHAIWLGGEVFLSPYFSELIKEAAKYPDLKQRINTNGLLITKEWAEKLVQGNVELIYSIDSVNKTTYEYIRKGGRFEDLIKSLENIQAMKIKYKKKFEMFMNVVVMRSNYKELDGILEFAKKYEFKLVQFMPIQGQGTMEHIFAQKDKDADMLKYINQAISGIEQKAKECNIQIQNSLPSLDTLVNENAEDTARQSQDGMCYLPWQQIMIYPDGNARFGCFCERPIGNILNSTIQDVWNSDAAQLYREHFSKNTREDICSERCTQGRISLDLLRVGN